MAEDGEDINEELEWQDSDIFQFRSIGDLSLCSSFPSTPPFLQSTLTAISNKYGFVVFGNQDSIIVVKTALLVDALHSDSKQAPTNHLHTIPISSLDERKKGVTHVGLACDELSVGVVVGSQVLVLDVRKIFKAQDAVLSQSKVVNVGSQISQFQWSPISPNTFCVLRSDGISSIYVDGAHSSTLPLQAITSVSWNLDGTKIAVGGKDGVQLLPFPHLGNNSAGKKLLAKPSPDLQYAHFVRWLNPELLVVGYLHSQKEESSMVYFYNLTTNARQSFSFPPSEEPVNTINVSFISQWNLAIIGASDSNNIETLRWSDGSWVALSLEDESRPELPLIPPDDRDTFPRGIVLDLTSTTPIPTHESKDTLQARAFPCPVVIVLTNIGVVRGFYLVKTDATAEHPFMRKVESIPDPVVPPPPTTFGAPKQTQAKTDSRGSLAITNSFAIPPLATNTSGVPNFDKKLGVAVSPPTKLSTIQSAPNILSTSQQKSPLLETQSIVKPSTSGEQQIRDLKGLFLRHIGDFNDRLQQIRDHATALSKLIAHESSREHQLKKLTEITEAIAKRLSHFSQLCTGCRKQADVLSANYIQLLRQYENARALLSDKRDASYLHLLDSRKLDSESARIQELLRSKFTTVRARLQDVEWHLQEVCDLQRKSDAGYKKPAVDRIYQTLLNHFQTVSAQKQQLEALTHQMEQIKLQARVTTKSPLSPSTPYPLTPSTPLAMHGKSDEQLASASLGQRLSGVRDVLAKRIARPSTQRGQRSVSPAKQERPTSVATQSTPGVVPAKMQDRQSPIYPFPTQSSQSNQKVAEEASSNSDDEDSNSDDSTTPRPPLIPQPLKDKSASQGRKFDDTKLDSVAVSSSLNLGTPTLPSNTTQTVESTHIQPWSSRPTSSTTPSTLSSQTGTGKSVSFPTLPRTSTIPTANVSSRQTHAIFVQTPMSTNPGQVQPTRGQQSPEQQGPTQTSSWQTQASPVQLSSGQTTTKQPGFGAFSFEPTESPPSQSSLGQKNPPSPSSPTSGSTTTSLGQTHNSNSGTSFGQYSASSSSGQTPTSAMPSFGQTSASTTLGFSFSQSSASTTPSFGQTSAATTPSVGKTSAPTTLSFDLGQSSASTTSSFGQTSAPSTLSFSFGQSSASTTPSVGQTSTSTTPSVGQTSAPTTLSFPFGQSSASTTSSVGQTSTSTTPSFGQTSTSTTPSFGQTSAPSTPSFGQSSFPGTPSFGQTSAPSTLGLSFAPTTPSFGQTSTPSTPSFGQSTASTTPSFGQTSAPSFQSSAATQSTSSIPIFGQTSASTSFGQSSFGQTSFATQPSFGQTSIQSITPFGQASGALGASQGGSFGTTLPSFGSPSFGFGSPLAGRGDQTQASTPPASSGFAKFASSSGGFASFASPAQASSPSPQAPTGGVWAARK